MSWEDMMTGPLSRRQAMAQIAGLTVSMAALRPAFADDYPSRPIRLIVPLGPGGPTDVAARLITQFVPGAIGQPLVVENKPGAGGAIGSRYVATAEPDGYTLMLGTSATLCIVPELLKDPGYDPVKSFVPVAQVTESMLVLAVANGIPANTAQDFVAYAKANPDKLTYSSAGVGNQTQLLAEVFKARTGTSIRHIPYKSGGEMVTAVLAGQTDMCFPDVSICLPLVHEKKLKALAVTGAKRHPALPDVPTMAEAGVKDFVMTFWSGVVAPANTPQPIVNKLNQAISPGLKSADVQATVNKIGVETRPGTAQDFRGFIAVETKKWRDVVELTGIEKE
jgi:tripartite-type tricarboxylate transporter receptor subunit TctC